MITRRQAVDTFYSDDLIGLGMEADRVRKRLHPDGIVSYVIDGCINFTGVLPRDTIFAKIQDTIDLGGTGILLQSVLHPDLKMEWYEDLLRTIKSRFDISCHCFSAPELVNIAQVSGLSLRDTIARLRDSGLDSISEGGAGILGDSVRHRAGGLNGSTNDWIEVHRTAHALGMRTAATMRFGTGETIEERMNHLDIVRHIQEDTGGFAAFIPWFSKPEYTSPYSGVKQEATAVEYLKMLALSRIYLNNILNIQASWTTPGLKVCQLGVRFGGNDIGSITIKEDGTPPAGTNRRTTEEELRRLIRDAGFVPRQRDTLYRTYFLN